MKLFCEEMQTFWLKGSGSSCFRAESLQSAPEGSCQLLDGEYILVSTSSTSVLRHSEAQRVLVHFL